MANFKWIFIKYNYYHVFCVIKILDTFVLKIAQSLTMFYRTIMQENFLRICQTAN